MRYIDQAALEYLQEVSIYAMWGTLTLRGFLLHIEGYNITFRSGVLIAPGNAVEFYNMKHSSTRNVIEHAFGVLKIRWALLRDTSWYSPRMVGMFSTACCLLHNFIIRQGGTDVFDRAYGAPLVVEPAVIEPIDEAPAYIQPTEEWTEFRDTLAQHMWSNRRR